MPKGSTAKPVNGTKVQKPIGTRQGCSGCSDAPPKVHLLHHTQPRKCGPCFDSHSNMCEAVHVLPKRTAATEVQVHFHHRKQPRHGNRCTKDKSKKRALPRRTAAVEVQVHLLHRAQMRKGGAPRAVLRQRRLPRRRRQLCRARPRLRPGCVDALEGSFGGLMLVADAGRALGN